MRHFDEDSRRRGAAGVQRMGSADQAALVMDVPRLVPLVGLGCWAQRPDGPIIGAFAVTGEMLRQRLDLLLWASVV